MSGRVADEIRITGLRVLGTHGHLAEEQVRQQPFVLDLTVRMDTRPAAATDDLHETVDYAALAQRAAAIVHRERYRLLERLAERICQEVLADPRVLDVTVAITKPHAPLGQDAASVGVVVTRDREDLR